MNKDICVKCKKELSYEIFKVGFFRQSTLTTNIVDIHKTIVFCSKCLNKLDIFIQNRPQVKTKKIWRFTFTWGGLLNPAERKFSFETYSPVKGNRARIGPKFNDCGWDMKWKYFTVNYAKRFC